MYAISKLKLNLTNFAGKGPVIATKSEAIHPFRDGHSVQDEVIGHKVTVILPGAGYEQLEVKVEDRVDVLTPLLEQADYNHPVLVDFENFVGKIYDIFDKATQQKRQVLSVKATSVRILSGPGDDLLIE